jgi:hypothetical protein
VALALAVFESRPRFPAALVEQMQVAVEKEPDCYWRDVQLNNTSRGDELVVSVESRTSELPQLLSELESIAEQHLKQETRLRLNVDIMHVSEP